MAVIKINSTDPATQGDHVLINEEDFDAAKHTRYGEAPAVKSLDDMTVAEMKKFAAENGIDLGDATKKDDVRAAIDLAQGN